jgi:probable HAF family extracellular repeat protein
VSSVAYGVSADGSVIGGSSNSTDGVPNAKEAFRWTESTGMVGLGYLSDISHESIILGMSGDGSVLAGWGTAIGVGDQSFYWTEQTGLVELESLGGESWSRGISSDGSSIIGKSQSPSGYQAFHWNMANGMEGIGDLSGGVFESQANSTNSDGSIIVGWGSSSLGSEAFRWTESEGMIGLGDLDGGDFYSDALDISTDGSIIVGVSTTALGNEAFIWDDDNGMRSVIDILENEGLDLTGWTLTGARGISADGLTIVGNGINPDGYTEAWIATVPEPGTISFLAVGAMAMLKKRKC